MCKKSFCMNCNKEVEEDTKECKCKSKYFVYGEKFSFIKNEVVCDCGSNTFEMNMHMNYIDKSIKNFMCKNCKNVIGTEYYKNEEDSWV